MCDAFEFEEIVDEPPHHRRLPANDLLHSGSLRRRGITRQHADCRMNRGERVSELVAHDCEKLVFSPGVVRTFLLQPLALSDVAVDFEDAHIVAVGIRLERPAAVDDDLSSITTNLDELAFPIA